jgi:hypothetical protein
MIEGEYREHQTQQPQQVGLPATREAITLRTPLVQEAPRSDEPSHEVMVGIISWTTGGAKIPTPS